MKEKFLPIGTVVLLKNGQKKIMITGYLPVSNENNTKKIYDYSACLFPEGILSNKQTAVFNHEQIAEIIQEGYSNEETAKFVEALKEILAKETSSSAKEAPAEVSQPVETTETLDLPIQVSETVEPPQIIETPVESGNIPTPVENAVGTAPAETVQPIMENVIEPAPVEEAQQVAETPAIVPNPTPIASPSVANLEMPRETMPEPLPPQPPVEAANTTTTPPTEISAPQSNFTEEQGVDMSALNNGPIGVEAIKPFSE